MNWYKKLKPPQEWKIPVIVLLGAIVGLGFYILHISKATSYVSDNPKVCVNCHVMTPEYITWRNSSHREWATCNDCHVPQDNVAKKYFFKAKDGLYHASVYTTRTEPQVIRMKEMGQEVVHQNCIRCHQNQVTDAKLSSQVKNHWAHRTDRLCWECHREVPHGKTHSLSTVNYANDIQEIEIDEKVKIPSWLKKQLNEEKLENLK
ncbi:cytochrome c nitrite reductase small subunit [Fulvivirgaceae bacterium BMA10]|uniref:Cytochrome c nitrite reductase small subunit n=1 Tax=Splendidivirga corallicola TaxID=3051826 RepID=A0ABT8KV87_9BACT|nr:cytochrome c nitrite reductase small subunit [Fulvivirgaceae bacterium BMA10]